MSCPTKSQVHREEGNQLYRQTQNDGLPAVVQRDRLEKSMVCYRRAVDTSMNSMEKSSALKNTALVSIKLFNILLYVKERISITEYYLKEGIQSNDLALNAGQSGGQTQKWSNDLYDRYMESVDLMFSYLSNKKTKDRCNVMEEVARKVNNKMAKSRILRETARVYFNSSVVALEGGDFKSCLSLLGDCHRPLEEAKICNTNRATGSFNGAGSSKSFPEEGKMNLERIDDDNDDDDDEDEDEDDDEDDEDEKKEKATPKQSNTPDTFSSTGNKRKSTLSHSDKFDDSKVKEESTWKEKKPRIQEDNMESSSNIIDLEDIALEDIREIETSVFLHRCLADSLQAREAGDALLENSIRDSEDLNMDAVYTVIDFYKKAILLTKEVEVEMEAIALSRLGNLYDSILKDQTRAKQNFMRSLQLAGSLQPRVFHHEGWYKLAAVATRKYQAEYVEREEEERTKERAPYLTELKEHLEHIKKEEEKGAVPLLKFIYKTWPPKNINNKLEELTTDPQNQKQALKKAIVHYHPDKQDKEKHGMKWFVLAEEITKILTRKYEYFKF